MGLQGETVVWYVARGGQQFGPLSNADFLQLLTSHRLQASDHVWQSGMREWVELREIENRLSVQLGDTHRQVSKRPDREIEKGLRYRAFLSYSHTDETQAKWLHRSIERFKIDKELVGRRSNAGPIPANLRPIFRDREEFVGGRELSEATLAALDQSEALIVICGIDTANKPAVNEEIRLFKSRHPHRPVIPVIVGGEFPGNFPEALRFEVLTDGTITHRELTVLAADLRNESDGRVLGIAKVVAGLIGVGVDEIHKRFKAHNRRLSRIRSGILAVVCVLALVAAASATYAWIQLRTNNDLLHATLEVATRIVTDAVQQGENYKVPRAATLTMLTAAESLFVRMSNHGEMPQRFAVQKAKMLIEFAKSYEVIGQSDLHMTKAADAIDLMNDLLAKGGANSDADFFLATAQLTFGDALRDKGKLAAAVEQYSIALKHFESQLSDNQSVGYNAVVALSRLSEAYFSMGNLDKAADLLASYLPALAQAHMEAPNEMQWLDHLSNAQTQFGDILKFRNDYNGALASYRQALSANEQRVALSDNSPKYSAAVGITLERLADTYGLQGNFTASIENYRKSVDVFNNLLKFDRDNTQWLLGVNIGVGKIGDNLLALGEFSAAKAAYEHGLAISTQIANRDMENVVNNYIMSMDRFRMALAIVLVELPIKEQARSIARELYSLKYSATSVGYEQFRAVTVKVFRMGRPTDEAKRHLFKAAETLQKFEREGRLDAISMGYAKAVFAAESELR